MARESFSFIPNDDVEDFLDTLPPPTNTPPSPPALPEARRLDDIVSQFPPPTTTPPQDPVRPPLPPRQQPPRIRIETTDEQLEMVSSLFHEFNDSLSGAEISARTRVSNSTACRLLLRLRNGEDITKRAKRGRKPKYTPELLKALSTKLCFEDKTIRETQQAIITENMQRIASEALPVVSASSIQRYVTNGSLLENDSVALSFAQCTIRGLNANSEAYKDLRIERMTELDQFMRAGFTLVFVDESHWNVSNVS